MHRKNPLWVNVRHLARENKEVHGELSAEELELNGLDELVQVAAPIHYELVVQKTEQTILALGRLSTHLTCQCARCLKSFTLPVKVEHFVAELTLEEAGEGDFVDLTPAVREDMVLAFPQHPLCEPGRAGLRQTTSPGGPGSSPDPQPGASAWTILDKLKLD